MDQSRDELLYSNVKGKNPFKDRRVRQAFYQAIDENAIARTVMRGAATPSGVMIAPGIRGFRQGSQHAAAVRSRGGEEAADRGRLSQRLRGRHELPERSLRQRRGDLPGGGGDAGEDRRQGQPDGRDQGDVFSQDPVAQHVVLSAGLDARLVRCAQPDLRHHHVARPFRPGPVQSRQLLQQARRRAGPADRERARSSRSARR